MGGSNQPHASPEDTDGDLILDGVEDADGDGLSNADEFAQGSDPLRPDTDEDGVRDGDDPNLFSGVVYRHADHLGSTALTTHADDSEVVRAVYRPFGEAVRPSAGEGAELGEFGYTGQRFEPQPALYDYGARWYDPALGRFLQPDPIVGNPFDPQSLNRYSYVLNDPGNRVDPTGMNDVFTSAGLGGLPQLSESSGAMNRSVGSWAFQMLESGPGINFADLTYSDIVPRTGGSASVVWSNGSGSRTSGATVGKGTFKLEQGTGNTTFGPRSQRGTASVGAGTASAGEAQQASVVSFLGPLLARLAATRIGARVLTGIGLGSLLVSGPTGVALRSTIERAATAGGPTIQAFTRLTQAPQIGRALSTAVGPNAQALAQAARAEGQLYSAQIPQGLVSELSRIGLAGERVTQIGNVVGTELRFLPGASEFVAPLFRGAPP